MDDQNFDTTKSPMRRQFHQYSPDGED